MGSVDVLVLISPNTGAAPGHGAECGWEDQLHWRSTRRQEATGDPGMLSSRLREMTRIWFASLNEPMYSQIVWCNILHKFDTRHYPARQGGAKLGSVCHPRMSKCVVCYVPARHFENYWNSTDFMLGYGRLSKCCVFETFCQKSTSKVTPKRDPQSAHLKC